MSDYPCNECGHEGRGIGAHSLSCSRQQYSGGICGCGNYYLLKGQKMCEDCERSAVKDFRGQPIFVGDLVAYAGRKPSSNGVAPRGGAKLVLCKVTAIDPVVKRVYNQGKGPKITIKPIDGEKALSTRDMGKIVVVV